MRGISKDKTMTTTKPWALRITAYALSLLTLLNPVTPAIANILDNATIERDFSESPLYLQSEVSDYQYKTPEFIEWPSAGTQSLEGVYAQLIKDFPSAIGEPTYVPISVGDITTFIPTYTRYKYIGTAAAQARYVRTQISAILGRNLYKFSTEAAQLDALYANAMEYMKQTGMLYGDELLFDQAGDTEVLEDMIWPELRTINGQPVIVPIVYLSQATIAEYKVVDTQQLVPEIANFKSLTVYNGELKAARDAFLSVTEDLQLSNANLSGEGALKITAGGAFDNLSSVLKANGDLTVGAGSIHNTTVVYRYDLGHEQGTRYGEIAEISSSEGDVILESHEDIVIQGAKVAADEGGIKLNAGGNILVGTQELYRASDRHGSSGSQVSYLQSYITAEQTISLIAGGQIVLLASEIASDKGHIELLAGLGVSVLDEQGVEQYESHTKFGSTTTDISAYKTVAIRSVLDAGKGIKIHSDLGNITLRAADISSGEGTSVKASQGMVNMLMTMENDHYSYSSVKESLLTIKTQTRGHQKETVVPNTIVGGFEVEALYGVNVQFEGDPSLPLAEQITQVAKLPGMDWLQTVYDSIGDQAQYDLMQSTYDEWKTSSTSLSPAAIAIIAIAAAMVVGPAALQAGQAAAAGLSSTFSAVAGSVATATSAAVTAGVTSFVSQAAVAGANGAVNGDFHGAMEDFVTSSDTWKSVATSMVTAAAISYVDTEFFTNDAPTSAEVGQLAQQQNIPLDTVFEGSAEYQRLADELASLTLGQQAAQVVVNSVVNAGVQALADGGSLSDFGSDFEDQFKVMLLQNSVNSIGKVMATKIGQAYKDNDINNLVRYIAHAGAGCFIGIGQGYGTQNDEELSCLSGAGGAVVGELVADAYKEAQLEKFMNDERARVDALRGDNFSEGDIIEHLQSPEMEHFYSKKFEEMKSAGVDLAKLSGAFGALLLGGDVNIAASTAENAAANNALFLIPLAFLALKAIDIALTSKDLWQIYAAYASGNAALGSALLADFIGGGAVDAAAGKIAGKLIPGFKTGEELLKYLNKNGYLSTSMMNSVKKVFDSNHAKAGTPPNSNSVFLDTSGKSEISISTGSRGAWDKRVNGDLEPDKVFKLDNGHAFITDGKGRVTQVGGDLNPEKFDRNFYQQRLAGKMEADSGYDGGHLIGHQLGGAGDKINLVPMTTGLNRGQYLQMENEIAKSMLDTNVRSVSIKIDVGYPPTDTVTPNIFIVTSIVDDVPTQYIFEQ